jgi:dTDP-4-dehydrorhamnose reductase
MKILIAGATGQLGRCLLPALNEHQVAPLNRSELDVARLDQVRKALAHYHPDLVINASAFNQVDGAESRVTEAFAINAVGPRNLAVATAANGIPLLHVSTDYVFDGSAGRPYHEFDSTNPLSVYGASKLAGEEVVRALNHKHYIIRTAWLFWEHGRNFLTAMRELADRTSLSVASDQHGSPTYVPHLARGITQLVRTEAYGTYHLAGRGGATRWHLVKELFRLLGIQTPVLPVSRESFGSAAERPANTILTSIQDPPVGLPPWQEGLAEFARSLV